MLLRICGVSLSSHAEYDIDDKSLYPPEAQQSWHEYQRREIPFRIAALNRIGNWHLGTAGKWIDVGAGTGIFARMLRDKGATCDCVEVSVPETQRLVAAGFSVFQSMDGIPDGTYNRIHCNAVIEHVPDANAFARDLHRICSTRGRVFVGTISESTILVLAALVRILTLGMWDASRYVSRWHVHYMGLRAWCRMLRRAGFSIERAWTTSFQQPPRHSWRSLLHRMLGIYHINIIAVKQ